MTISAAQEINMMDTLSAFFFVRMEPVIYFEAKLV